jgi:hypothetical protein
LSEAVVEHLRDKLAAQSLQHPGKISEVLKLVTDKKSRMCSTTRTDRRSGRRSGAGGRLVGWTP